jgi:hypothetical protein
VGVDLSGLTPEQESQVSTEVVDKLFEPLNEFHELLSRQEELHPDLAEYLDESPKIGTILRHPLVFSVPYAPLFNGMLNKNYEVKKKALQQALDEKDWHQYVYWHERPYRVQAFLDIVLLIKKSRDYWELLRSIWTDSENLCQTDPWVLRSLLSSGRPDRQYMMDADERRCFKTLPDEVRVYRGHSRHNRLGFSWTLDIHIAWWFAHRYGLQKGGGVITGLISKDQIKALFLGRNEMEIVALPNEVREIKPVQKRLVRRSKALDAIFKDNWAKAALHGHHRSHHGLAHWNKVDYNAVTLARLTPGADMKVVRLFAAFHDCKRIDEGHCLKHGRWAAEYIRELHAEGKLGLTAKQLETLTYACAYHDDGKTSDDPTIGVCWDADRMELIRVGMIPTERYFSTKAGKELFCKI